MNEKFPALVRDKQVKIRAWDLCETILEEARKGEYSQMAVNRGLPAMQLIKYFKKSGSRWTVKPKVREIVTFESMNLARPWPSVRADVVFLRNVLIYFDVATKSKILGEVRKVLRPGGYMFMGAAESTRGLDATFERVAFNRGCCYQLPGGSKTSTDSASRRLAG